MDSKRFWRAVLVLLALVGLVIFAELAFGDAGAPPGGPPGPGGGAAPPPPAPEPEPEPEPEPLALPDLAAQLAYCNGQITAVITNSGAPYTGRLELVYLIAPAKHWMGEPIAYHNQGLNSWSLEVVELTLSGLVAGEQLQHQFQLELAALPGWQQTVADQVGVYYPTWIDPDPGIFWVFLRVKIGGPAESRQLFGWAMIEAECE